MIARAIRLLSCITIFLVDSVESFAFGGGGGGGGCNRGSIVRTDAILRCPPRARRGGSTTTTTTTTTTPVVIGTSSAFPRSATATRLRSSPTDDDVDDGGNNARVVGGGGVVDVVVDDVLSRASSELGELSSCLSLAIGYLSRSDGSVSAEDVILACDAVDAVGASSSSSSSSTTTTTTIASRLSLRKRVHEFGRYRLLSSMMRSDYDAYVATAEFLSPGRVPRSELPNVQDVGCRDDGGDVPSSSSSSSSSSAATGETPLVPDCELIDMTYDDSPLDRALLYVFRKFVAEYTGLGAKDEIPGIGGLLAQGREYMTMELPPGTSYADHADAQHDMVKSTLGKLMTPALPPFYRVFMSGIVPKLGTDWDGKQLGPWFYAPYLTSIVTPVFFGFLVGPSRPNRRKDGMRGGLVVEKCKFLQESKCKGLCLHQCKIPAQEFFAETLGLDLTVRPNFVTQECQWSFGEKPLPVGEDPAFPRGCLAGCESRAAMAGRKVAGGDALCM